MVRTRDEVFCLGICQNWVNCDCATVLDKVPHRTTNRQNNLKGTRNSSSHYLCAAKQTGWPGRSAETVKCVQETFVRSLEKSTHHASLELQMPQTSDWFIQHKRFCTKRYWDTGCTCSTLLLDGPGQPAHFTALKQPHCWNFLYHSWTVLSISGSLWYLVWNLHCTITVLANSKTQKAFLPPVLAMFHHNCIVAVKPASTPWCLLSKKIWKDSLPTDILSFVSVLIVVLLSSEIPETLMNYPVDVTHISTSHMQVLLCYNDLNTKTLQNKNLLCRFLYYNSWQKSKLQKLLGSNPKHVKKICKEC
jgi:hypothetical protein